MKISIITVVLNQRKFLPDCIKSIGKQTFSNIEYIIIDGGSTDGTVEIIKNYEPMIDQWISEKDQGIYDAMNKGIRMATGEVVGFLNGDDLFYASNIMEKISGIFKNPEIEGCYGDLLYMNRRLNRKIRLWIAGRYTPEMLKKGWMLPHPTLYLRKGIYEQEGLYDTEFKISADYELMLRLLKKQIRLHYLAETMVIMRTGGKSTSGFKNLLVKSIEDFKAWKVNEVGITPLVIFKKPMRKLKQYFLK